MLLIFLTVKGTGYPGAFNLEDRQKTCHVWHVKQQILTAYIGLLNTNADGETIIKSGFLGIL